MRKKVLGALAVAVWMTAALGLVKVNNTFAASCGDYETSILPCTIDDNIGLIKAILEILVGAGAVIGLLIMGIQYMTARDNVTQMAKAKSRFIQILIGLIIFAAIDAILTFLGVGSSGPATP